MGMNTSYIASLSGLAAPSLGDDDLQLRILDAADVASVVEATSAEPGHSLWGPLLGPYTPSDARAALTDWDPAAGGQFSVGIFRDERLLGAVGLIPDGPGSVEVAYWLRPEERGQGIASRAALATTLWAHEALALPRVWLEIEPGNDRSERLAQRIGFRFEERLPRHCRTWTHQDPEQDTWHDCLIWAHEADGPTTP
ncbi:GNAT family N-acetyltransferase [Actinomadura harenae]|nr:GNAT family N-acetyltransferase [Actinomadura harenae]